MPERDLSAAASSSVERGFARAYTSVLVVSNIEVVANSLSQSGYLNAWTWVLLAIALTPVAGMVYWGWVYGHLGVWPLLHGAAVMTVMLMWPWVVIDGNTLPAEFQPWIWWAVGMAIISVGVSAPIAIGIAYLVLAPVVWWFLDTSYFAGNSDPWVSLQDSFYALLIGGTVTGLIFMVRQAAERTDRANSANLAAAIAQAQIDAVERERQRIDALIHDRVLNTLVLASKANTPSEQEAATGMASEAIESLEAAKKDPDYKGHATVLGLYRALRKAALRMNDKIVVNTHTAGLSQLPSFVAEAITEATIQALDNAIKHSRAQRITLNLGSTTDHDVTILVSDDGVGFRLERVAKDRIGIRTSIRSRLEAVGANADVKTELGVGTTVKIGWSE